MKPAILAFLVCLVLLATFGCLGQPPTTGSNRAPINYNNGIANNAFFTMTGHLDPAPYMNATDIAKNIAGNFTTATFTATRSAQDVSFILTDDAGNIITSASLLHGTTLYNRTLTGVTYDNFTLKVVSNYTGGGSFPSSLISWLRFDEGTGNTTADYLSNNTLELGTGSTNRPGWTTNGKVNNATTYNGSGTWARINQSADLNFSDAANINFTFILSALFNGSSSTRNNGVFLLHQGSRGADNSSFYLKSTNDGTNDTLTASFNRISAVQTTNNTALAGASGSRALYTVSALNSSEYPANLSVAYQVGTENKTVSNSTLIQNANSSETLAVNSSWYNVAGANAILTVTYALGTHLTSNDTNILGGPVNSTGIQAPNAANNTQLATLKIYFVDDGNQSNASLNGYSLGQLGASSPKTFTIAQGNLTLNNNLTFNTTGSLNVTNVTLSYQITGITNVSVNGFNLGILSNGTTNSYTFNQQNLSASTTIAFSSTLNGTNVTNASLNYSVRIMPSLTFNGVSLGQLSGTSPDVFTLAGYSVLAANNVSFTAPASGNNITGLAFNYTNNSAVSVSYLTKWDSFYHVLQVGYNTTNLSLYVDRVLVNSTSFTALTTPPTTLPFYLGDGTNSTNFFNGYLDELYLFNSTLTAGQTSYIYNQSWGVHTAYAIVMKS